MGKRSSASRDTPKILVPALPQFISAKPDGKEDWWGRRKSESTHAGESDHTALALVPVSRRGVFWTSDLSGVFPIALPCMKLDNVCEVSHPAADM